MTRAGLTSALAIGALVLIAGCGSGDVSAVAADQASNPLCAKAAEAWPDTVANEKARATSAKSDTVHAWGDPAIIARCGVTSPGATTDPCFDVSGIDWVGHKLSDGYRFVTFGRSPALEVLVPQHYSPEPMVLGAFTSAAKVIPQGAHRCTSTAG